MIDNSSLINAYTHLRDVRGKLTYQQVATDMGLDRSVVSKILNNKKQATADFTKRFEAVYNIDLKKFREKTVLPLKRAAPVDWQTHVNTRFAEQEGYNLVFEEKLKKIIQQNEEILKLLKKAIGR